VSARTDRRIALFAGTALALICILGAAVQVAVWTMGSQHRSAHRVLAGPVSRLRVEAVAGDITILPGAGDDVTIDSRVSGTLHAPPVRTSIDGGVVNLSGGCPAMSFGHCHTSIVIHVPAATGLDVDAASGDVEANGLAGAVKLHSASGDVRASDLTGDVSLRSGSGDIEASGLGGATVSAGTGSGDVTLRFDAAPRLADAETNSGDVRIVVPAGSGPYSVDAETDSGTRDVAMAPDPASPRRLRAHTGSGDARVEYE
jgi:hypothetical protein